MTAALAIAAISEVLGFIVEDALLRAGQALSFTPPPVTIGPLPARPPTGEAEAPGLNLFMWQALPNSVERNTTGFTRSPLGDRSPPPPLTLDLLYLLSAHGAGAEREIGLATAMLALHQTPAISTTLIRRALTALAGQADPLRRMLASESLISQLERFVVKFQTPDVDSAARLWAAAQSPLRPSAFYQVTITLSADAVSPQPAPPVVERSG